VVTVGGRTFKGTTSRYNYAEQLAGLLDHKAIKPFVNQASLYGTLRGDVFLADTVLLRPIPDQTASDDPALPRHLFIGDSISGNYGKALRDALGVFLAEHVKKVMRDRPNILLNGTRTPCIIRDPKKLKAGRVDDEHVLSTVDIAPTILKPMRSPDLRIASERAGPVVEVVDRDEQNVRLSNCRRNHSRSRECDQD